MKQEFVEPQFAKSEQYRETLETIKRTGRCPFCKQNFKYHKNSILKEEKDWFITKNSWPYKNTKHHFIIISKKHKQIFKELSFPDFKQVYNLANWVIEEYKIKGGALALRFGSSIYTGSTVSHLHFHLIVPLAKKGQEGEDPVCFSIG